MTAIQRLNQIADLAKAVRYPNVRYRVKSKYTDRSANDLTTCIVDYLQLCGYFSTRLSSTGVYREDLKKFVPSQQRSGMPDVFSIVNGFAVFVEVKFGKDTLSDVQKRTISDIIRSGGYVFLAKDFQSFCDWFSALESDITVTQTLPFDPAEL